jgi:hypothetical protein
MRLALPRRLAEAIADWSSLREDLAVCAGSALEVGTLALAMSLI